MSLNPDFSAPETRINSTVENDPNKFSLGDFLVGDSKDPLKPPPAFTQWLHAINKAVELYEPVLLGPAAARAPLHYRGKSLPVINFSSYNYLGLANRPEVIAAAHDALATHGLGACGSPVLSGMSDLHRQLEKRMAEFLGYEDAMLFNSGFGGALGTISGLLRKSDVAVMDNRSHLSLRDGAVVARTRCERFDHNDPESLDRALTRHKGKRHLVIVEGIYSMDGDFGQLDEVMDVADAHGASVFVDEAHSMLACGENGRGAVEHFGIEKRVRMLYGTFSKAFGAMGGFVAGSREMIDYLRFYSHPYVYSCALPPVMVASILKALELGTTRPELRQRLWEDAE